MPEETSLDDFFDAMDSDYQTEDIAEETDPAEETIEDSSDAEQEAVEEAHTEENSDNADEPAAEEKPQEASQQDQTYVLRVNHEDKTVTHEELMNFAQMGVDYARVKTQLEQAKNDNSGLSAKVAEMQSVYDTIKAIADASKMTVEDLARQFEETQYKAKGYSESEAKLAVERDHARKQLDALNKKPTQEESNQERMNREVAEFQQKFPGVDLSQELVSKVTADVQAGMSLSDAYQKMLREENAQRIKDLETQLAAAKQNAENRKNSPGSVSDVGTKRKRDSFDDFFDNY